MLLLARYLLEDEGTLPAIPGLTYVQDGKTRSTPVDFGPYSDVACIPLPDYSLLDEDAPYMASVVTSRGCLYACHFCSEGRKTHGYRPLGMAQVEAELRRFENRYAAGALYLSFADDTFTVSPERVHSVCDIMDRLFPDKSRFGFYCEGRVNVLAKYPELVRRMKASGLVRLQIGIESGSQALLDRMNKQTRVEQITAVVSQCSEAAVPTVFGAFICGLPGQTEEDVRGDIEFAKRLVDLAPGRIELEVSALTPFPGTEFRENAEAWGLELLDDDFVTGTVARDCFGGNSELSRDQVEQLVTLFKDEVSRYSFDKACSFLTAAELKEFVVPASERQMLSLIVRQLWRFRHVEDIVTRRRRKDHRFLSEVLAERLMACAPVRADGNTLSAWNDSFVINERSPKAFELTAEERECYRYFAGKLTFEQIADRLSAGDPGGRDRAAALCMRTYRKCEDNLAAIVMV